MNIELIETGRDGALTEYRVTNAAHLKEDFYTDMVRVEGNDLTGRCSKADLRKIRSWIERQNAPEAAARATAGAENTRRVLIPFGAVSVGDEIAGRSEEHTSEIKSRGQCVCRLMHEQQKSPLT